MRLRLIRQETNFDFFGTLSKFATIMSAALIVLSIGIMGMLRIGKPVDHEEDAVPRVD